MPSKPKRHVPVDVNQDKIELMLAAFKVAESWYVEQGKWEAAKQISNLNIDLRKQIFEMEQPE